MFYEKKIFFISFLTTLFSLAILAQYEGVSIFLNSIFRAMCDANFLL